MADGSVLIVGVGNELRADDGAGIEAARRLQERELPPGVCVTEQQGEPLALLDTWAEADAVVLIDTMRSGAPPGTIRRFDISRQALPRGVGGSTSTHALMLQDVLELGRELGRLPAQVIVLGVEGRTFHAGQGLSNELRAQTDVLADLALGEAIKLAPA